MIIDLRIVRLMTFMLGTSNSLSSTPNNALKQVQINKTVFDRISWSADTFATAKTWRFDDDTYGEIKIVPNCIDEADEYGEHDWNGPWKPYRHFFVYFGYAPCGPTKLGNYFFVDPRIGLEGWRAGSDEGHDLTVPLFETASPLCDRTVKDLQIRTFGLPPHPRVGAEYKAAAVTGTNAPVFWTVYFRFVTANPGYSTKR